MQSSIQPMAESFKNEHKSRHRWHKVFSALAMVVVFFTTYALILPALTWERTLICELPEHVHTEACYTEVTVEAQTELVCGQAEHQHTDECYITETAIGCGIEEHTHTDACYQVERELNCTDPAHQHNDSCYEAVQVMECTEAEHTHTDECYQESYVLTCTETDPEHVHTDACFETQRELICTLPEHTHTDACCRTEYVLNCTDPSHEHTDACYQEVRTLICALPEHAHSDECNVTNTVLACTQPEHIHTEECRETTEEHTEKQLACGYEEHTHTDDCFDAPPAQDDGYYCGNVEHTHNEYCYFADGTLKCTIPEHIHTDICESNPEADLEDAASWEAAINTLELTGEWSEDVLTIAQAQLGYTESAKNFEVEGGLRKGYTRYGAWYGIPYGDWCAMFCSFCINYAQVKDYPIDSVCQRWADKLDELKLYHPYGEDDYEPKPGDLVFFSWNESLEETANGREAAHVGFVYELLEADDTHPARIKTIEGNCNNCVCYAEHELDEYILGWVEMTQNPENNEEEDDGSEEITVNPITVSISCDSEYIYLTATLSGISADDYDWQWQRSENGAEPWEDLPEANSLTHSLINSNYNARQFYRITGTPKETEQIVVRTLFAASFGSKSSSTALSASSDGDAVTSGGATPSAYGNTRVEYYWVPITTVDELTTDGVYMLVSNTNDVALYGLSRTTSTKANMTASEDLPDYYQTSLGAEYWWTVSTNGASSQLQNISSTNYLNLDASDVSNLISGTGTTITFAKKTSGWRIQTDTYKLSYSTDYSRFARVSRSSSGSTYFTIYKRVVVYVNDDPGTSGEVAIKPTYPAYMSVSGALEGDTALYGVEGNYYSDPATSKLEAEFNGAASDDGRVTTDKSVIYGKDDYGAFQSYDANTFGVELSALGQSYALTGELNIPVPLDVVFVLDTSGSMVKTENEGGTSAEIMVKALNNVMSEVLNSNADNRVGVVCYSGSSKVLLPLGHYQIADGKFFEEKDYNSTDATIAPKSGITRTDGDKTFTAGSFTGWWGTYTQHGIATGAKVFLDNNDTTVSGTVTQTIDGSTVKANYTAARRPVIILLSDGDPTYCTSEFSNVLATTTVYGDGNAGFTSNNVKYSVSSNNNKGVMGYYTILSAQYYKNVIGRHYNTDAYFYSVGIGMYQSDDDTNKVSDSFSQSVTGDDYKRAVLNPTAANIAKLSTYTNGVTASTKVSSANKDISDHTETTARMLYQLLNNEYGSSTVTVRSTTDASSIKEYGLPCATSKTAKVVTNPYKSSSYSYANGAYFTQMADVTSLTQAFMTAIGVAQDVPVYGFILKNNTPVTISDTIGAGMELKSVPVLRYNGQNYAPVGEPVVSGNVTTYHYAGTTAVKDYAGNPDGSGRVADLSKIYAEVVNDNGTQTVRLIVPDSLLPNYYPNLSATGTPLFYYEQLPVRLIYQVGLTKASEEAVADLAGTGNTLTYYTNAWTEDAYSNAVFQPTAKNPYYKNNNYNKTAKAKTDNNTGTASSSLEFGADSTATSVEQKLGNNGKLVFSSEVYDTVPLRINKLDYSGNTITTDTAIFELFSDAELTKSLGTFETENGVLIIPKLRVDRIYYLVELKAPEGFEPLTGAKSFTISAEGVISMQGTDEFFKTKNVEINDVTYCVADVVNDYGHVSRHAEKRWEGTLAAGESYPASVQFQLYADGVAYGEPVTVSEETEWECYWNNLPAIAHSDGHQIVYTVVELPVEGYTGIVTTAEDGTFIVTNRKINPTSLSVYKKWVGGTEESIRVELLINGEPSGQYAVLNADNNWYYMWSNLPDIDSNGDKITYSVREFAPEGYESDIHLWTGPGDPYGQTSGSGETRTQVTSFTNGQEYLLVFEDFERNDGSYSALTVNNDLTQMSKVQYNYQDTGYEDTEVTDKLIWKAAVDSKGSVTLTNKAANKRLVLIKNSRSSSYYVALESSSKTSLDTDWNWVLINYNDGTSGYTLQATYNSTNYTFDVSDINSSGRGDASTNHAVTVYPQLYTQSSTTEDDVVKGDTHYIIVNTKHNDPSVLTVNFIKADDKNKPLAGAVFALYRETGNSGDTLIPGSNNRYGVAYVEQWTSTTEAKTVTIRQSGTYYLVEVTPPDGYQPLTEPIVFEVTMSNNIYTATVKYHPVIESGTSFTQMTIPNVPFDTQPLPETGGSGIALDALGLLLTAGAMLYGFFTRRKRERRKT